MTCELVPCPASPQVLSQSDILSTASAVIKTYPSITSAYLFGSYAKGTPRPDSDVDIVIFVDLHSSFSGAQLRDFGGTYMDLESAFCRKVDLSVCPPPDDFVTKIKAYWVPINLR